MRRGRIGMAALATVLAVVGLWAGSLPASAPAGAQEDPAAKLSPGLQAIAESVGIQSTDELSTVAGLPPDGAGSLLEGDGGFLVYVQMSPVTPEGIAGLEAAGATIVHVSEQYQVVTAAMNPGTILPAAEVATVSFMSPALEPRVARMPRTVATQEVGTEAAPCPTGVWVSEGDTQLKAALARSNFGVDGTGVKIGILSDSFDKKTSPTSWAGDVAAAELPGSTNPCGYLTDVQNLKDHSGADEGRAMAQAIHDLAPGAQLAFRTAFDGEFAFADYIRKLRFEDHADVIVDDVGYFDEPFFQDGPVAVAVNDVVADGAVYFSSAGNENVTVGANNVSSYEAPAFRPATCPPSITSLTGYSTATCHDFDTSGGVDVRWDYTLGAGGELDLILQWSEPWYGVTDDFAICGVNPATDAAQCISQYTPASPWPYEGLRSTTTGARQIVIVRKSGSGTPRLKFMLGGSRSITSVQYATVSAPDIMDGSSIFGHPGSASAAAVAAVPYSNANTPEAYTSHGNVTHYWGPVVDTDPAAALGAPEVIAKPQFAATDGGQNSFFGSNVSGIWRFYGTSQSAPHAAAVAALMLDLVPGLDPATVVSTLGDTAVPVSNGGTAVVVGDGLIDANAALDALPPAIVTMSPSGGQVGTSVVLAGTNFTGASAVSFNGTGATFVVNNDKRITTTVPVGATTGPVSVTAPTGTGTSSTDFFVGDPPAGRFTGITPVRALDTRNSPPCVGTTPRNLTIGGQFGVPADATAVALNVTAVNPSAAAFLTVWPRGTTRPLASNLNFVAGQIVPNMVTVKLGQSGGISLYADNGCPDVVVDIAGYFTGPGTGQVGPGGFEGITPVRALDTRNTGPCVSSTPRVLVLAGQYGIPPNASAVALNVTVVQPSLDGFLTVWPADKAMPPTSNLNFVAGQIVPNMVTVGLSTTGTVGAIRMASDKGCPNVVVDVAGYFQGGGTAGPGGFTPITPARALDTRNSPPCVSNDRPLDLTTNPLPAAAAAAALNITVVTPTLPGFLTAWPADKARPLASNLNFVPGQIVPNMATVQLSPAGAIKLFTDKGCPDVVVDAMGWYSSPTP